MAAIPLLLIIFHPAQADEGRAISRWTVEDVLRSEIRPFAIGHRGFGENLGSNPDKPIENTTESVRRAFRTGAQIVEVDAVMTKDHQAVALHDDFLDDLTCVNQLTFAQLRHRFKAASTLKQILQTARTFSVKKNNDRPSGQVIIEIKTPAPLCDPADTTVPSLVAAVLKDVNHTKMEKQVLIESFSPEIIATVSQSQPSIPRILSLSLYQLLSPQQIADTTGLPVTEIDKQPQFGLQWLEVGAFFRVPIYESPFEYANTLLSLGGRAASLDKTVLAQMEAMNRGSGALFVSQLHQLDVSSLVYTVNSAQEWQFLSALGVDGFYTDNLLLGLTLEGD